jgi:hypothetical protein
MAVSHRLLQRYPSRLDRRNHQGARRFQTRLDDWPRRLPDGGVLIRDVSGDFYRVADAAQLDRTSRALLWAFVD